MKVSITFTLEAVDGKLPSLAEVEKAYIQTVFKFCGGHTSTLLRHLEIHRTTFYRKQHQYDLFKKKRGKK